MTMDDYLRQLHTIYGWCLELDVRLLALFASATGDGDVLEIGTLEGKSAIALGYGVDAPDRVIVCDPILDPNHEHSTRPEFEANYRRFHGCLPVIHGRSSDELGDLIPDGSVRFAHVDGSHDYEFVRSDIALTERLSTAGGVIALDDFNDPTWPEVMLGTWESVIRGFVPLVLSPKKMYGTWHPERWPEDRVGALLRDAGMEPHPRHLKGRSVFVPQRPERYALRIRRAVTPPYVARRSALLTGGNRRRPPREKNVAPASGGSEAD